MATHSSILAWRMPWTEEPGGLQLMGLQRVGHDVTTKPLPPPLLIARLTPGIHSLTAGAEMGIKQGCLPHC